MIASQPLRVEHLRIPQESEASPRTATRTARHSWLAPGSLRQPHRPAHDPILEVIVGDLLLARSDLAAHRDARRVHGIGIARHQGVPPVEIMPISHQAVSAGGREPDDPVDVTGGQLDAVVHLTSPVAIVSTLTALRIEQLATDISEEGPARIIRVLELDQAAAATAVTEALP